MSIDDKWVDIPVDRHGALFREYFTLNSWDWFQVKCNPVHNKGQSQTRIIHIQTQGKQLRVKNRAWLEDFKDNNA